MQSLRFLIIFLLSFQCFAQIELQKTLDQTQAQCLAQTKVSQKMRGDLQRKYDEIQESLDFLAKIEVTNLLSATAIPTAIVFMSVRGVKSVLKMVREIEPTLNLQQRKLLKENKLFSNLDSLPANTKAMIQGKYKTYSKYAMGTGAFLVVDVAFIYYLQSRLEEEAVAISELLKEYTHLYEECLALVPSVKKEAAPQR